MRRYTKLYCIRHGETSWNAERRYQGQADTPMNGTGLRQAQRNADALKATLDRDGIDAASLNFVASPLGRTRQTMQIVRAGLGLDPDAYATDERILEVHYGIWQGRLADEIAASEPNTVTARKADPFRWRPQGGESYSDLRDRVKTWLNTINRDTVVVTHGGVTRVLRIEIAGIDPGTVLTLPVPQDQILILHDGAMSWA